MSQLSRRAARMWLLALLLAGMAVGLPASFRRESVVEPFESDSWNVWTTAGPTRVRLTGGGATDLDCYVRDRAGRLLAKDDGRTDECAIRLERRTSGHVEIRVVNLGERQNRYTLSVQ